jgi:16S rRNA (guanine(966)-N(2))-methyltransferase RsmD
MRISSGYLKGRSFSVPSSFPSRPTTDFAKEGLFNVLGNQMDFEEVRVLDLFAGTGNLSFEFISRGALGVTCVDKSPKVTAWLKKNAASLGIEDKISLHTQDALAFVQRATQQFDLIIADPPYDLKIHNAIVQTIFERNLLRTDGQLIMEHGKFTVLKEETNYVNTRTFGNVNFSFFK